MTIDQNKAVVRRFAKEIFLGGSDAAVDELLTDDFVAHTWPSSGPGNGKADLKAAIKRTSGGLADVRMTIDDLIPEDDRVAMRMTSSAKQVGAFMGIPPSGRSYEISEIHIFRLRDGKVCEHWHEGDFLGMMKQLGATPGAT